MGFLRKVAVEYVELCGLKNGEKLSHNDKAITQDDIAQQLGISKANLTRLLEIERKLTPEIKQLLDDGIISKTSASKIWVKLSEQEQEQLLEELGKDKITEMTQLQMQQYIYNK